MTLRATALAHPNIAFIKYWGMRDEKLKLPANDSISMNIGCLSTRTTVEYHPKHKLDSIILNGEPLEGQGLIRVQTFMDQIRQMTGQSLFARINSENNFPIGAGVASSASAFAALALAATAALGLNLSERELSNLARLGSGSACRSIPGGFVEWRTDPATKDSFAFSIAAADHWKLVDCIAILSEGHKAVGSEDGMRTATTSPFQSARISDSPRRLDLCRRAIQNRDFASLAKVVELDSNMMHSVMMTSNPPLFYWQPGSLEIIKAVKSWQSEGIPVTYTLDAGPNVHVLCPQEVLGEVIQRLRDMPGVIDVLKGFPAGPARLIGIDSPL
jgi:diphosphomevalonate decarboxylase